MIDVGLGRDIWLVPFSHITLMFKVCSVQPKSPSPVSDKQCSRITVLLHRPIHLPSRHRIDQDIDRPAIHANLPEVRLAAILVNRFGSDRRPGRLWLSIHYLLRPSMRPC